MKIGKYELITVETGRFRLDGGAMFGVIPKPLWEISHPADELNRIELVSRNLILKSDSKTILVDTGIGQGWDEKFTRIYQVDHRILMRVSGIRLFRMRNIMCRNIITIGRRNLRKKTVRVLL